MESFNLFCILSLLGGLAFFLYGMNIMSASLEKIAGGKLEKILKTITSNKYKGLFLGFAVTAVIQSSSAVTVMLVGLVNSGLMKLSQVIGVIMGTNIGTTATAWILSLAGIEAENSWIALFKPDSLTPILAFAGMLIFFIAKSNKNKNIGNVLLGFAILMTGMILMGSSMAPLSNSPKFIQVLTWFDNPLFGILAGAILTAIIQSSSASVGMLQALVMKVDMSCGAALPIIMGQNIGTCITAWISSIGVSPSARKVAVVHLAFNIIGTAVFLTAYMIIRIFVEIPYLEQIANPAKIAILHSAFNIATTILLFPFVKQLEKIADFFIREESEEAQIVFDDRLLISPELALVEANQKVIDMTDLIKSNFIYSTKLLKNYKTQKALVIAKNEQLINSYETKLKEYLVKISNKELSVEMSNSIAQLLLIINEFKHVQKIASNIFNVAEQKFSNRIDFSAEFIEEFRVAVKKVRLMFRTLQKGLKGSDMEMVASSEEMKKEVSELIFKARANQMQNVQCGKLSMEYDHLIFSLLADLDRIVEHCMNVSSLLLKK